MTAEPSNCNAWAVIDGERCEALMWAVVKRALFDVRSQARSSSNGDGAPTEAERSTARRFLLGEWPSPWGLTAEEIAMNHGKTAAQWREMLERVGIEVNQ